MKLFVGPRGSGKSSAAIIYSSPKKVQAISGLSLRCGTIDKYILDNMPFDTEVLLVLNVPKQEVKAFVDNYGNSTLTVYKHGFGKTIPMPEIVATVVGSVTDIPNHHHFNQRVDVVPFPNVLPIAKLRDFTDAKWPHKTNFDALHQSLLMMQL